MESLFERIGDWLKGHLIDGIMDRLSEIFDSVNEAVSTSAEAIGQTPAGYMPNVYSMIRNIAENVILPIAGIVLTFVACYELIRLVTESNNLAGLDLWILFKWIFKTAIAVLIVSNTFNIVMAVFDLGQHVINRSFGLIQGSTAVTPDLLAGIEEKLNEMNIGQLLGMYLETFILSLTLSIIAVVTVIIIYGRLIEIYLVTSLAPIPLATLGSREHSVIGRNYFRSLLALAFQGFLMMICIGIYSMLIRSYAASEHLIKNVWLILLYSLMLAFGLFKTGSISKSIFNAH